MATFTVITDKEAPPPTRKGNGRFGKWAYQGQGPARRDVVQD